MWIDYAQFYCIEVQKDTRNITLTKLWCSHPWQLVRSVSNIYPSAQIYKLEHIPPPRPENPKLLSFVSIHIR